MPFASKYRKQLLGTILDALKTAPKTVVHKAANAAGEFIKDKITNKFVKTKPVIDENPRNVEKIIIPPGNREEILNELRQVS